MRRILLDCDPGHDDAIAILLAAGSPQIELAGITTVAGNQTLDKTTRNALAVAAIAGLQAVPVVAGCDRPMLRPLRTAGEFHGESGLDGPPPAPAGLAAAPGHAVDFLVETLLSAPGQLSVVATGPLTNIAVALCREPAIAESAREIVIMGGAYSRGNVTPAAEFNIFVDPEAAAIVLGAPWKRLTLLGLDLTHQAVCPSEVQKAIASLGTRVGAFTDQLLEFFRGAYRRHAGMEDPPVHDACAVAYVAAPELFTTRPATVEVELQGRLTAGMTVVDFRDQEGAGDGGGAGGGAAEPSLPQVAVRIDAPRFWNAVVDALTRIG